MKEDGVYGLTGNSDRFGMGSGVEVFSSVFLLVSFFFSICNNRQVGVRYQSGDDGFYIHR